MKYAARFLMIAAGGLLILGAGCATKVTRVAPDTTTDLTGKWNDTDSRMVTEEMIKDCMAQPWLTQWEQQSKRPVVIIGTVRNKSHEHISTETFTKDMERALLNSGRITFVANKTERDELRDEKADQAENATAQTAQTPAAETGANLMLIGSINTIVDQEGSKAALYYQTNLELVEIQSNQKVWVGEKKIKKYVERAKVSY